ncbi:MAG TPA: PAS domain S-box protein, partial [Anaerolineales bacterium]|nr:PAS domain S-box protein [Anaerolineales bacterium]
TPAHRIEYRMRAKNGEYKWILDQAKIVKRDSQGKPLRMGGTHTDITERKQAEEKLRASEEQYRFLLDNSSDFIARFDRNGIMLFGTEASVRFIGYRPEEVIHTSAFQRIHPEDQDKVRAELARIIESGLERQMQYRVRRKSGEYIWVEAAGTRVFNQTGEPEVIVVQRDITKRKLAEEKLRESEVLLRQVLESIPDSTFALDRAYRLLISNQRHQQDLIASGGHPLDVGDDLLFPAYPPEVLDFWQLAYDRTLAGEQFTLETSWVANNGQARTHENRFSPLRDATDTIIGALVVAHDITERKQAEAASFERQRKLDQLMEILPVGISILNEAGEVVFNNPALRNILQITEEGLARGDYHQRKYLTADGQAMPPEGLASAQVRQSGRPVHNVETGIVQEDGKTIWTNVSALPMEFPDWKTVIVTSDITERKQAEERLRESEEKYRGLMETLDSAVATIDYDGKFLYMNEVAARQLGSTPQALIGKTMHELFPAPIAVQQLEGVRQVIRADLGRVSESLSFVQGEPRWYHNSLQPIHDERGQVVSVLLHTTDVHELKSTQQELQSRNRDMTLLLEAGRAFSETLDTTQIYALLHRYISGVMPCDMLIASSYNPHTELLHCEFMQTAEGPQDISDIPPIPLEPPGKGTQSQVIRTGKSLLIPDYDQAFREASNGYILNDRGQIVEEIPDDPERPRSVIVVPLRSEGEVVGALQVFSSVPNAHTEDHLRFVEALAFRVSAALSNARLFAELEQRVQIRTAEVRDLYDNAPTGYHSLDTNGRIIMINQTELNWLG